MGVITRKHLLCRQDIHKHQYNLEGVKLHSDDHTSVSLFVAENMRITCESEEFENPVIIYKQQGQKQPNSIDDLSDEDFIIGLQTPFQRDMLTKFGSTAVCMDSTMARMYMISS